MARQLGVHGKLSRRVTAVLAVCLAIFPALGASAQSEVTRDDIAEADANRRAISAELEAATIEYDTAVARLIELEDSLTTLGIELAALEQDLALARVAAQEVATDRYVYAGSTQSALFGSTSIDDVRVRTSYLDILSRAGTDIVLRLFALEESYEAQEANVALALENQEETSVELEAMAASILTQLEEANAEYNTVVAAFEKQEEERRAREEAERLRREEEERRRLATSTTVATTSTTGAPGDTTTTAVTTTTAPPTTTPPPPSGSLACPVNGAVAFTDTWGAPRSGGRSHKGVDMIAARGTPLVAIEAGTIKRLRNSGLGGITVVLAGASGDEFYYAHLDGWAPGLSAGQSVAVGELIGYVGNTGNAQYTVPHLHFEHSPGGNGAVNPYPLVAGLCL
ncbi:MAG: peptidoglycan DD-metalloendopeptidase family protein [bacterium]|nr:peptidoglycan DD-metalloendopeptidase family protein [bacterium]